MLRLLRGAVLAPCVLRLFFFLLPTVIEAQDHAEVIEDPHPWHSHDCVNINHPWYHRDHVYIYNGHSYPYYYSGHPYYYYDPRFYYYDTKPNENY